MTIRHWEVAEKFEVLSERRLGGSPAPHMGAATPGQPLGWPAHPGAVLMPRTRVPSVGALALCTAVLQTLVRDGLLTQQNQRRWASYRVAEDSPNQKVTPPNQKVTSLIWRETPLIWRETPRQDAPQWAGGSPQFGGDSPQFDRLKAAHERVSVSWSGRR